ncbi:hypothetical protein AAFF_G00434820 [Aldrovandia affinis]|uniref:BTB domain-containing protein n=1 Tax=Aldrovandia affinis TaxID=143900 RepID=A0AAD7S8C8_9TELE|nr:hypothetical protein AAFF_G00434820 [Aldrovandia affinis]
MTLRPTFLPLPTQVAVETSHMVDHLDQIVAVFSNLYWSEDFSDVELVINGAHRFKVHRAILGLSSDVFHQMFSEGRWQESGLPEVPLTEEESCVDHMNSFLQYFYTGVLSVDAGNLFPLLVLTDKYNVAAARRSCEQFALRSVCAGPVSRALSWWRSAERVAFRELEEACQSFVSLNAAALAASSSDWLSLEPGRLRLLLESDELQVESEFQLFCAVKRWLSHNEVEAETEAAEILEHVRFPLMSPLDVYHTSFADTQPASVRDFFLSESALMYQVNSLPMEAIGLHHDIQAPRFTMRLYTSSDFGCSPRSLAHPGLLPQCGRPEVLPDRAGNVNKDGVAVETSHMVDHLDQIVAVFSNLYWSEDFSDVELVINGAHRFKVHRAILGLSSDVFHQMFSEGRWQESGLPEVPLTEEESCVDHMNSFLHGRSCEQFALRSVCAGPVSRALSWWRSAERVAFRELEEACQSFVSLNAAALAASSSDWLSLEPGRLRLLLESDELQVESEFQLFCAVKRWLSHNEVEAETEAAEILEHVRFPLMSPLDVYHTSFADTQPASVRDYFLSESALMYQVNSLPMEAIGLHHDIQAPRFTMRLYTSSDFGCSRTIENVSASQSFVAVETSHMVDHLDQIAAKFSNLYWSEDFSDVELVINGAHRFKVHRAVLAMSSDVFRQMFSEGRWQESGLPEVPLTEEESCVDHMNSFLSTSTPASSLSTPATSSRCCRALSWWRSAERVAFRELEEACRSFVSLNAAALAASSSDWLSLEPGRLRLLLESDELRVENEFQLFCAVKRWLSHNEVSGSPKRRPRKSWSTSDSRSCPRWTCTTPVSPTRSQPA